MFCPAFATLNSLAEDEYEHQRQLVLHSSFDDVTDLNLFGADGDDGWIYTAESTLRKHAQVQNRCRDKAEIAKGEGTSRDCFRYSNKTEKGSGPEPAEVCVSGMRRELDCEQVWSTAWHSRHKEREAASHASAHRF